MESEFPYVNFDMIVKKLIDKNDHSMCNPDETIHLGNYLNQLGCIHNDPNDSNNENATYVWSKRNKQWKRTRYYKNHNFCSNHKECVYWTDSETNEIEQNKCNKKK